MGRREYSMLTAASVKRSREVFMLLNCGSVSYETPDYFRVLWNAESLFDNPYIIGTENPFQRVLYGSRMFEGTLTLKRRQSL